MRGRKRVGAAWRIGVIVFLMATGLAACQPLPPPSIRAATPRPADVTPAPTQTRSEMAEGPGLPTLLGSYPSPDGAWQVEVIRYDCADTGDGQEMALDVLRLIRVADGQETIVARQVQYCAGLGAFGLGGLFWAPGGRYFYYTTAREGQPDGGCGSWVPPVARVDVEAPRTPAELAAAVRSPDGTKIAGWQAARGDGGDRELVVWDVDGDEVQMVESLLTGGAPGPIVWSPDGTRFVYPWAENVCPPGYTQLVSVPLITGEPETLLESGSVTFAGLTWEEPGALTLTDETGAALRLDLSTHRLTPAQ